MNKYSSYVDLAEDEYKQNNILLQYFIDLIKLINKMISENYSINDNQNELILNEIISNIYNIKNNYRNKYENEKDIKLYPFLNEALLKIINLIFSEDNTNNIINNSIYGKSFVNNNASQINYINRNANNSIMNDTYNNMNNNLIKTNRTVLNINSNNISNFEDSSINLNLNNIPSLYNTQRQSQNPNNNLFSSPSSSPTKRNNNTFLNKTFSNTFRPRYNNMQPINEEVELNSQEINIENININIPQLPSNIINNFNLENIRNYKIISNFLIEESRNLLQEQSNYYNKKNANNKLNILRESGEYSQYNNIFEQISRQEQSKANHYLKEIQSKSSIFEMIKNNCEENFNFIFKYPDRNNVINNKLSVLIKHIEDYNKHFNSKKNKNTNYFDRTNNIENIMNNTFTIDKRNNELYYRNFNESILTNSIMNNDRINNRLINNTSKSSNFKY